jgi:hypothetical protein
MSFMVTPKEAVYGSSNHSITGILRRQRDVPRHMWVALEVSVSAATSLAAL